MSHDDPETILGVDANATDEEIRLAYLAKVKQFPPERAPEEFERIRDAYDMMRDPRAKARRVLFGKGPDHPLEKLLDGMERQTPYLGPKAWIDALASVRTRQEQE